MPFRKDADVRSHKRAEKRLKVNPIIRCGHAAKSKPIPDSRDIARLRIFDSMRCLYDRNLGSEDRADKNRECNDPYHGFISGTARAKSPVCA